MSLSWRHIMATAALATAVGACAGTNGIDVGSFLEGSDTSSQDSQEPSETPTPEAPAPLPTDSEGNEVITDDVPPEPTEEAPAPVPTDSVGNPIE